MRFVASFLIAISVFRVAEADSTPVKPSRDASPKSLLAAMAEAQEEQQRQKLEEEPFDKTHSALAPSLRTASTPSSEFAVLADEIDNLRNRIVVERANWQATQTPKSIRVKGAITVFNYRDDAVYEVSLAVEHVTDIQLEPGEQLTATPRAGDTKRWNVSLMTSGDAKNSVTHLVISPIDPDIETNLIIPTDRRTYHLKLRSTDFHMPSVQWRYPAKIEQSMNELTKRRESQESLVSVEGLHFNYDIEGDNYPWRPLRVFDDGRKTFLQMPKAMKASDAPALFLVENDEPLLVNYRVNGDYFVVDRLFEEAELRVGANRKVKIAVDSGKTFFERLFD